MSCFDAKEGNHAARDKWIRWMGRFFRKPVEALATCTENVIQKILQPYNNLPPSTLKEI